MRNFRMKKKKFLCRISLFFSSCHEYTILILMPQQNLVQLISKRNNFQWNLIYLVEVDVILKSKFITFVKQNLREQNFSSKLEIYCWKLKFCAHNASKQVVKVHLIINKSVTCFTLIRKFIVSGRINIILACFIISKVIKYHKKNNKKMV